MLRLTQFLIVFCVDSDASVKDIPGIKEKIYDSATSKNNIILEAERSHQEAERKARELAEAKRSEKQAEVIDEVIDEITDFFINPPSTIRERFDPSVSAQLCYDSVIIKKMKLNDFFDINDIVEILEMLVESNFLTKKEYYLSGILFIPDAYTHKKP